MSWYNAHAPPMRHDPRFQAPLPPNYGGRGAFPMTARGNNPPRPSQPYTMLSRGPVLPPPPPLQQPPLRKSPPPSSYAQQQQMRAPAYGEVPPPSMYHHRQHFSMTSTSHPPPPMAPPPAHHPREEEQQQVSPHHAEHAPASSPPLKENLVVHNVRRRQSPTEEPVIKDEKTDVPEKPEESMSTRLQDAATALASLSDIILSQAEARQDSSSNEERASPKAPLPSRLALPEDEEKLNRLHCFLRSELLELFFVDPTIGRVGLRCVHCAQARKFGSCGESSEAPMAVIYPKSISELYRLVTSWQRVHLRKCRNLPKSIRETYTSLKKNDKTRGKTHYWTTSAQKLGLVDNARGTGIRYNPE